MSIFGPFHHPTAAPPNGSLYRRTGTLQLGPLRLEGGAEVRQAASRELGGTVAPSTAVVVTTKPAAAGVRPDAGA
ncbi:hypothetical protein J421_5807 (plasmid) [Gemmatirosa kalamazoonensis]|uniref:Uncharacterized protein n=1 Tax=Gemmatirosa kalamazoonensis TaxID=861299 RepID=W0RSA5_9BACT|nr:hypothetical protein [Gemmatirosa kalamazoonensis]AHG93342.1 hypothetical protein J421_5807 [Gemmatirosa kalamazoonensis]